MLIWIIAALFSGFIKGLCGVGDTPVFSSILSFAHNNIDISPVSVLTSLPANMIISWQNRKALKTKIWLPMALLLVVGSIPGTVLLKNTDTSTLKLFFGVFIVIVGIAMLYNELGSRKIKASKALLLLVGILSGLSSGLFGIGVLLVVYITLTTDDLESFRGNICAIFASENAVRFVMYIILGLMTPAVVKRGLIILPFSLAGVFLGTRSVAFLDERKARIIIMCMLIFSGAVIVATNL